MKSAKPVRSLSCTLAAVALACTALPATADDFGRNFGYARGWSVDLKPDPMGGCIASPPGGVSDDILMVHLPPAGGAQLAIVSFAPEDSTIPGEIHVGRYQRRLDWYVSNGMAWETADADLLTQLARAATVQVRIGNQTANMSLAGSTAAMLMLQDCWVQMNRENGVTDIEQTRQYQSLKRDFASVNGGAVRQPAPPARAAISGSPTPPQVVSVGPAEPDRYDACPAPAPGAAVRSPATRTPELVTFHNRSQVPLTVYWYDFDGNPQEMFQVRPGVRIDANTYSGHLFVARDALGGCYGGVLQVRPGGGSFALQ